MEQVTGTHDDGVKFLARTIGKVRDVVFKMRYQWHFFYALWPLITERFTTITDGHGFGAIFVALGANIFGRIATTY